MTGKVNRRVVEDSFYGKVLILEIVPNIPQKSATDWNNEGLELYNNCYYHEAINAFNMAIRIDTKYKWPWSNAGVALSKLGQHQDAIYMYEKAIQVDPNFSEAWSNKGESLNVLGRYQEALFACDKAIQFNKKNEFAWYNKGNALIKLHKYEDGIDAFEKAIQINPNYVEAINNKKSIQEWLNNNIQSKGFLEKFLGVKDKMGESPAFGSTNNLDFSNQNNEVFNKLLNDLKNEDKHIATDAAEKIGKLNDNRAIQPLIEAYKKSSKYGDFLGITAAEALYNLGSQCGVDFLLEMVCEAEPTNRMALNYILENGVGDTRFTPGLKRITLDEKRMDFLKSCNLEAALNKAILFCHMKKIKQ